MYIYIYVSNVMLIKITILTVRYTHHTYICMYTQKWLYQFYTQAYIHIHMCVYIVLQVPLLNATFSYLLGIQLPISRIRLLFKLIAVAGDSVGNPSETGVDLDATSSVGGQVTIHPLLVTKA